jgi:hypothetical protein
VLSVSNGNCLGRALVSRSKLGWSVSLGNDHNELACPDTHRRERVDFQTGSDRLEADVIQFIYSSLNNFLFHTLWNAPGSETH